MALNIRQILQRWLVDVASLTPADRLLTYLKRGDLATVDQEKVTILLMDLPVVGPLSYLSSVCEFRGVNQPLVNTTRRCSSGGRQPLEYNDAVLRNIGQHSIRQLSVVAGTMESPPVTVAISLLLLHEPCLDRSVLAQEITEVWSCPEPMGAQGGRGPTPSTSGE
uniref:Uncharacterized protein n=1 Tax=Timema bartmani TaxID=61472 RepID=A0A7R9FBX5_9NEOP|nr:unnamed protein product [Timema bartmani]